MPKVYRGIEVPRVVTKVRVSKMVSKLERHVLQGHTRSVFTCYEFQDIVQPLRRNSTPEVIHKRKTALIGWQHLLHGLGIIDSGAGFNDARIKQSGQKWLFKASETQNGRRLALLKDLLAALEAQA